MSLTHEQAQLLAQREAQLQAMHAERFDAIAELARLSGAVQPAMAVAEPWRVLDLVGARVDPEVMDPETVQWITPPLAYFLGELWVSRFGGHWLVNPNPQTRTFGHIVVGGFFGQVRADAVVSPFEVVLGFLNQAPPRDFRGLVREIEAELRTDRGR